MGEWVSVILELVGSGCWDKHRPWLRRRENLPAGQHRTTLQIRSPKRIQHVETQRLTLGECQQCHKQYNEHCTVCPRQQLIQCWSRAACCPYHQFAHPRAQLLFEHRITQHTPGKQRAVGRCSHETVPLSGRRFANALHGVVF